MTVLRTVTTCDDQPQVIEVVESSRHENEAVSRNRLRNLLDLALTIGKREGLIGNQEIEVCGDGNQSSA